MDGFNIARFLFLPGRKVYGLLVEAEIRPEVLNEIFGLAFVRGVLIPTIQYNLVEEGKVVGFGFMDFTDADISVDELAEKIQKVKGVLKVQILYPSVEGFVADYLSPRLMIAGDRAIIMRRPGYEGLITGMRERFGEAGEAFLYHAGYDAGIKYAQSHQDLAEKLGIKDPIQIAQKVSTPLFVSMGLGKMEIVEVTIKPFQAILRVYECFECELVRAEKPFSNFIRGIFAGLLTQLFGRNMEAKELKCIAKGDPYCEFKITPE